MEHRQIYATLTPIFHDVFATDSIVLRPDMTAEDVEGWDSSKHIEIVLAIESQFGIKLRTKEIDMIQCVGDMVGLIAEKTSSKV